VDGAQNKWETVHRKGLLAQEMGQAGVHMPQVPLVEVEPHYCLRSGLVVHMLMVILDQYSVGLLLIPM
jgi:hypothetical protein